LHCKHRMYWLILALLPVALAQNKLPDGPRGGGPVFKKCGGGLFGGNKDICYEVQVTKLQFQMGSDGTDDDVKVKICDDVYKEEKKKSCCVTPVLTSTLSDDFSKNDLETWKENKLGQCRGKKFTIKRGLNITISKKGKDTLKITSLFVDGQTVTKDKKTETERFECGSYNLGKKTDTRTTNSSMHKFCDTSAYEYQRVKQINVTVGPDGTNDDVFVDICSNVNSACCKTKLSSLLSDDWSKNDVEVWKEGDLGKCKTVLYKVNKVGSNQGIKFSLIKKDKSKDDLIVNKIKLDMLGVSGRTYVYDCKDFKIQSQSGSTKLPCVPGQNCSHTKVCQIGAVGVGGGARTTKRPGVSPTRRQSQRIATSTLKGLISQSKLNLSRTTRPTTTRGTTTRPPFRSNSG